MFLLMQLCKSVDVFGVGAGGSGSTTSWHYFEQRNFEASREFSVDPHHSFELEHDVATVFHAAGLITHHKVDEDGGAGSLKDVVPDILKEAKAKRKERMKQEAETRKAAEAEEAERRRFETNGVPV